jgi:hypothetical protein
MMIKSGSGQKERLRERRLAPEKMPGTTKATVRSAEALNPNQDLNSASDLEIFESKGLKAPASAVTPLRKPMMDEGFAAGIFSLDQASSAAAFDHSKASLRQLAAMHAAGQIAGSRGGREVFDSFQPEQTQDYEEGHAFPDGEEGDALSSQRMAERFARHVPYPAEADGRKNINSLAVYGVVFALAALAIGGGTLYLLQGEGDKESPLSIRANARAVAVSPADLGVNRPGDIEKQAVPAKAVPGGAENVASAPAENWDRALETLKTLSAEQAQENAQKQAIAKAVPADAAGFINALKTLQKAAE